MRSNTRMQIHFADKLLAQGRSADSLRARWREGGLVRVYPGAFVEASLLESSRERAELQHAATTFAAARRIGGVVSGPSAANLHRLPLLQKRLEEPVLFTRSSHGSGSRWARSRRAPIESHEVTELYGMRVTTLERTIRDLADCLDPHELLAATDAALRIGFDPESLPEVGRNSGKFRWLREHASPRADSFGESWSRFLLLDSGLPAPVLQLTVLDEAREFVGRADFGWPELGALGEFDGRKKYRDATSDAIMAEKVRESGFVELGWERERWVWKMLHTPEKLVELIARMLTRAESMPPPRGAWEIGDLPPREPGDWRVLFGRPLDFPVAA